MEKAWDTVYYKNAHAMLVAYLLGQCFWMRFVTCCSLYVAKATLERTAKLFTQKIIIKNTIERVNNTLRVFIGKIRMFLKDINKFIHTRYLHSYYVE